VPVANQIDVELLKTLLIQTCGCVRKSFNMNDPKMSYPAVNKHLEARGATLETASDAQMPSAFQAAFREDLPLGMTRVDELAGKTKSTGQRAMVTLKTECKRSGRLSRSKCHSGLVGRDAQGRASTSHREDDQ
jgi:hypothetical protein